MYPRGYLLGMGFGSIILIISTWIGYSIDAKEYLTNILTEITSLVITIFFISIIIDRYHKYQKQNQWNQVRNVTYTGIIELLIDMFSDLTQSFPEIFEKKLDYEKTIGLISNWEKHDPKDVVDAINLIIKTYNRVFKKLYNLPKTTTVAKIKKFYCDNIRKPAKPISKIFYDYFKNNKSNIDRLRDVYIPRVFDFSDEQEIINELVQFDRFYHNTENVVKHEKTSPKKINDYAYIGAYRIAIIRFMEDIRNLIITIFLYYNYYQSPE